jgi:hypothetical protein
MRHTTFRFALEPTPAQEQVLARWAGASRFAYNQCLRLVFDALAAKQTDQQVKVPWSGFDLINAFNAWKRSEAAGRVFAVASDGTITRQVTGLEWRHEVAARVFEEAAVDLGRALAAYAQAKTRGRKDRTGFPRRKKKGRCRDSFRLRTSRAGVAASVSGSGTVIPGRSRCRRSARFECTTTPVRCGACSARSRSTTRTPGWRSLRPAPGSCSQPSPVMETAGM